MVTHTPEYGIEIHTWIYVILRFFRLFDVHMLESGTQSGTQKYKIEKCDVWRF